MFFRRTKKSIVLGTTIDIAIVILSFILIFSLIYKFSSKATDEAAEAICRGSVAANAKSTFIGDVDTTDNVAGRTALTPLLCKTLNKKIEPKIKDLEEEKKYVAKEIASYAARCWYQFGQGLVQNIFEDKLFGENKCFICYTLKIEEGEKLKKGSIIDESYVDASLNEGIYSVKSDSDNCNNFGGKCAENEDECNKGDYFGLDRQIIDSTCKSDKDKDGKKDVCCFSKYSCINKGGKCADSCEKGYSSYKSAAWMCGKKEQKCCINETNFQTPRGYIQSSGGQGKVELVLGQNKEFKPQGIYAIAIASPYSLATALGLDKVQGAWDSMKATLFNLEIPENSRINYILIGTIEEIGKKCEVQEDISGK